MRTPAYTVFALVLAMILAQPVGPAVAVAPAEASAPVPADGSAQTTTSKPKQYSYKVEEVLPHQRTSYTQGFFFHNGAFYESTGQYGKSMLAKVEVSTGRVMRSVALPSKYFGEGACWHNGRIYQLTWEERTCFVYHGETFECLGQIAYLREGWGITSNGEQLIMSDGSNCLYFLHPETFTPLRTLEVTLNGKPLYYLNELEFIEGEIWANVYTKDYLVRIDPQTGVVTALVDLKGLLPSSLRKQDTDVLNGIAYDPSTGRLWVTGKNWPKVYRITVH